VPGTRSGRSFIAGDDPFPEVGGPVDTFVDFDDYLTLTLVRRD